MNVTVSTDNYTKELNLTVKEDGKLVPVDEALKGEEENGVEEEGEEKKEEEEKEEEEMKEEDNNIYTEEENISSCSSVHERIPGNYDTLVIGGGALKGFILLGALQYVQDNYFVNHIKHYIGTSAGAMISYLLLIGYTPVEIMVYICTHQVIEKMKDMNYAGAVDGSGITTFSYIQDHLEKMTIEKTGRLMTLGDLKQIYGKTLTMATYNISKGKVEYLSSIDTPEIPCITAIRMSSNIPLFFEHFRYMGSFYIDGGIVDNFPLEKGMENGKKVLGVYVENHGIKIDNPASLGVVSYVFKMINIAMTRETAMKVEKYKNDCSIVSVSTSKDTITSGMNFHISATEKLDMFSSGYQIAQKYFES